MVYHLNAPEMDGNTETEQRYPKGHTLGDYEILRLLGTGATADVYLARHRWLENDVALKVVRRPSAKQWQDQYSEAICRLRHPNIVGVHFADSIEGRRVIATDFVAGRTLREVLFAQGRLEFEKALRVACSATSALEYVHGIATDDPSGLAHLNLSLSNILLDRNGTVRITDFGMAQAMGGSIAAGGETGKSLEHLAPEQFEGRPSAQSDIWAVGILLFEMLLGRAPYRGGSLEEYRLNICGHDPDLGPDFADLPAPLRGVILRCLRCDLTERFASASELASALVVACMALGVVRCAKCGEDLPPESDFCPECVFAEVRESIAQKRYEPLLPSRARDPVARFRWFATLSLLAAAAFGYGGYWLWRGSQRGEAAPQAITVPAPEKPPPDARLARAEPPVDTAESPPPPGNPATASRPITAASRQWEQVLLLEKEPGGDYEERIGRLMRFMQSYPDAAESREALVKVGIWQEELAAFRAAEELERRAGSKMCAILAAWQRFLARQTTGLCRSHALSRIQHWTEQVKGYAGYAELTIRSARDLPLADNYLLREGQPDPYLVLLEGDRVLHRSGTIDDNASPSWDEKVRIYISPSAQLSLQIWDDDPFGHELLAQLSLVPLPVDGPFELSDGRIVISAVISRDR